MLFCQKILFQVNRVFSANKSKKFVFNKIMFYLKLYYFYEINVRESRTNKNSECKEMFLSVHTERTVLLKYLQMYRDIDLKKFCWIIKIM